MLSKQNQATKYAYEKGYSVIDGRVFSPYGRQLKLSSRKGYYRFSVKMNGERITFWVHRLVAYQKYGDKLFEPGIQVRHKNNDSKNNLDDNILIGTQSDNMMDKKPEDRLKNAKKASSHIRKFTNVEVEKIREERRKGRTYKQLMEMFDISSKGTMNHILNNDYQTEKYLAVA